MGKVTIVLPTYNERENIKKLIPEIFQVFQENKIPGEVMIVDDSSPDGTSQVVEKLAKNYPVNLIQREKKLGIGSAYVLGFKKALQNKADVIFEMDADLSHSPKYIPKFIDKLEEGYEVVIGSRKIKGGGVIGWSPYRKLISTGGNFIGKYIAGIEISDLTSGFRAYKSKVLREISLEKVESNGYAFQLEMLARALKKGSKIGVIPIIFHDRYKGKSKLSRKDMIDFLGIALKIRLGQLR